MTQTEVPWFVAEKRARKADQIARHLAARGVTAAAAVRLTEDERRTFERSAGVKAKGSDLTWRSVIERLAGSHAPGALCLTCGIGDPDGEPGPRKPHGHEGRCSQ